MADADNPVGAEAHALAVELLPWYVNGSLGAAEHARVQAHLGACLVCRRELRRLELLARVVAEPTATQASAQAFQRLSAQIAGQRRPTRSWLQRTLGRVRTSVAPLPVAAASVVLALSIALLSAMALRSEPAPLQGGQGFQTLGARPPRAAELMYPHLRVVLRDDIGAEGLAAWLARHQAELVDGPSEIGVLTVRVALGQRSMDSAVGAIRADLQTLFAEPVDRVGQRPDRRR